VFRLAPRAHDAAVLAALLALLLLGGCRTAPPLQPGDPNRPWPEQRTALRALDRYQLAGRVAVNAGSQGFTASLRYEQRRREASLALDGPLGIGGIRVTLDGEDIGVATSRGEKLDGAAARAALEQRLGFEIPLAMLRWWLLGVPDPDLPAVETTDANGFTQSFDQQGWQVEITQRAPALGFQLPKRLTATRAGARLKLIVERWQP
jgi:outer membrane lipoprotein LolB